MDKNLLQEFQNRAFQAKTKEEWKQVLAEAKEACIGDENAYIYLKNYFTKILGRKKEYWEKYPPKEKKQFPIKKTVLLDEQLSKKIEQYYDLLILEKKLEIQNKYSINLD